MQLRTTLLGALVLVLAMGHPGSAEPIPARTDRAAKLSKRAPKGSTKFVTHNHYHSPPPPPSGGGMFGGGGSMTKNIVGGSLMAGGMAFTATGGNMAAHKLFGHHDDDREDRGYREGSRERGDVPPQPVQQPPVYQAPPVGGDYQQARLLGGGAGAGAPQPVIVLMSDGSWQSWPTSDPQQDLGQAGSDPAMEQPRAQYPAAVQPQARSPFTFPNTS